jgi:hypothetical protein
MSVKQPNSARRAVIRWYALFLSAILVAAIFFGRFLSDTHEGAHSSWWYSLWAFTLLLFMVSSATAIGWAVRVPWAMASGRDLNSPPIRIEIAELSGAVLCAAVSGASSYWLGTKLF